MRVVVRVAAKFPTNLKKNTPKDKTNPHPPHQPTTKNPTQTARNVTADHRTKTERKRNKKHLQNIIQVYKDSN